MSGFRDLTNKGYVLVRSFLSEEELQALRSDFESLRSSTHRAGEILTVSLDMQVRLEDRLAAVCAAVQAEAGIHGDGRAEAGYFATSTGFAYPWHQDHVSFFLFQQHVDYLNFYIPIIKPHLEASNLSVIPFDALAEVAPNEVSRLIGAGACRFLPMADEGTTRVIDDEAGHVFTLPANLDALAVTPTLAAGDLLLFRGDVIHKTQEGAADRVAVSFRRVGTQRILTKARLQQGGPTKLAMIAGSRALYGPIQQCFARLRKDEVSTGEYLAFAEKLISRSFAVPHYVPTPSAHQPARSRTVG